MFETNKSSSDTISLKSIDLSEPIDNNLTQSNISHKESNTNNLLIDFCTYLYLIGFVTLPLVDISVAFNDISCQNIVTPIGMSLSFWLQVYGYFNVGIILIAILFDCILHVNMKKMVTVYNYINIIYLLFSIPWLVIGFIIYWKYFESSDFCNLNISNYMSSRLIIGSIYNLINIAVGIRNCF